MASERRLVTGITTFGLSGVYTDIDDDPDSADANWLTTTQPASPGSLRITFATPTGDPVTGAGVQEFRLLVRKDATGGGDPTFDAYLRENNGTANLETLATAQTVTSATGTVYSLTWDASNLSNADGSGAELYIVFDSAGGGPNERWLEVGAAEWNVEYAVTETGSLSEGADAGDDFHAPETAALGDGSDAGETLAADRFAPGSLAEGADAGETFIAETAGSVVAAQSEGASAGLQWATALTESGGDTMSARAGDSFSSSAASRLDEGAEAGETVAATSTQPASASEGASATDSLSGAATVPASISEGASAGNAKSVLAGTSVSEGAEAGESFTSTAAGVHAGEVTEGASAGLSWATATEYPYSDGGSLAGDTFSATVIADLQTGSFAEGASAGETFEAGGALETGSLSEGASAGESITSAVNGTVDGVASEGADAGLQLGTALTQSGGDNMAALAGDTFAGLISGQANIAAITEGASAGLYWSVTSQTPFPADGGQASDLFEGNLSGIRGAALGEGATASDGFAGVIGSIGGQATEGGSASDAFTGAATVPASISDGAEASDSTTLGAKVVLPADGARASDSFDALVNQTAADSFSEGAEASDSFAVLATHGESLTEGASAGESFEPTGLGDVSEGAKAGIDLSVVFDAADDTSEGADATDLFEAAVTYQVAVEAGATATDFFGRDPTPPGLTPDAEDQFVAYGDERETASAMDPRTQTATGDDRTITTT